MGFTLLKLKSSNGITKDLLHGGKSGLGSNTLKIILKMYTNFCIKGVSLGTENIYKY